MRGLTAFAAALSGLLASGQPAPIAYPPVSSGNSNNACPDGGNCQYAALNVAGTPITGSGISNPYAGEFKAYQFNSASGAPAPTCKSTAFNPIDGGTYINPFDGGGCGTGSTDQSGTFMVSVNTAASMPPTHYQDSEGVPLFVMTPGTAFPATTYCHLTAESASAISVGAYGDAFYGAMDAGSFFLWWSGGQSTVSSIQINALTVFGYICGG